MIIHLFEEKKRTNIKHLFVFFFDGCFGRMKEHWMSHLYLTDAHLPDGAVHIYTRTCTFTLVEIGFTHNPLLLFVVCSSQKLKAPLSQVSCSLVALSGSKSFHITSAFACFCKYNYWKHIWKLFFFRGNSVLNHRFMDSSEFLMHLSVDGLDSLESNTVCSRHRKKAHGIINTFYFVDWIELNVYF